MTTRPLDSVSQSCQAPCFNDWQRRANSCLLESSGRRTECIPRRCFPAGLTICLEGWAMESRCFGIRQKWRYLKLNGGSMTVYKYEQIDLESKLVSSFSFTLHGAQIERHAVERPSGYPRIKIKFGHETISWNGSLRDHIVITFGDSLQHSRWAQAISKSILKCSLDLKSPIRRQALWESHCQSVALN